MPSSPSASPLRAPFVEPLAQRVRDFLASGKLDEDAVDRALTAPARAWVEGACEATQATPLPDVESLVALVASQVGGDEALSAWADEIVAGWVAQPPITGLLRAGGSLIDGPGFVASQACDWLAVSPAWSYSGGREGFELRIGGLAEASPGLRALFGALLGRLAVASSERVLELRVQGIDDPDLVVIGRAPGLPMSEPAELSRLHRAALVG